jgi:hypothetical protein
MRWTSSAFHLGKITTALFISESQKDATVALQVSHVPVPTKHSSGGMRRRSPKVADTVLAGMVAVGVK